MTKAMRRMGVFAGLALAVLVFQGMGPGKALGLVVGFAAMGLGLTAFVAWGRAAFPGTASSADRLAGGSTVGKLFRVGILSAILAFLVIALLGKAAQAAPPLGLIVLLALFSLGVVVFRGALGIWPGYGRLLLGADSAASPLQETLAGGALLSGTVFLFPVGILFFLYALVKALGVGVLLFTAQPTVDSAQKAD
ncbi:MAG TPA: hypothetical protein DCM05_06085 [Elusimicrobia bacterium]|nr:hypothetical protein [Elusimicrobiota bacterium]